MAEEEGPCWVDVAYRAMRQKYHMSDDEFWHRLTFGRLAALLGLDDREREDAQDLKMLELNGF